MQTPYERILIHGKYGRR